MDITNLGFFITVDLINNPCEAFEASIRTSLPKANNIKEHKLPKFQCRFSSPFTIDATYHRTAMKVYGLQCARKDIHQLCQYIEKAYQDNPTFIFQKLRHNDFHTYHNAIPCQKTYLPNQRVVPLEGILSDLMIYLTIYIEEIP